VFLTLPQKNMIKLTKIQDLTSVANNPLSELVALIWIIRCSSLEKPKICSILLKNTLKQERLRRISSPIMCNKHLQTHLVCIASEKLTNRNGSPLIKKILYYLETFSEQVFKDNHVNHPISSFLVLSIHLFSSSLRTLKFI
jgi:hypothetical protein